MFSFEKLASFVGEEDCVDVLEDPEVDPVFVAGFGEIRDAMLPNIPPSVSTEDLLLGSCKADICEEKNPEID